MGKPLYIFFRALNFTDDDDRSHKSSEGCLALYLEAEFNAHPDQASHCNEDPELEPNREIQMLNDHQVIKTSHNSHSIRNLHKTFYTYQDYYVPDLKAKSN